MLPTSEPDSSRLVTYFRRHLFYWLYCCHLMFMLTPWSRVLLEKSLVAQVVKKFPTSYGSRRFYYKVH